MPHGDASPERAFHASENPIHHVLLADDLLPANATFLSADLMPDRDGDSLALCDTAQGRVAHL
ncbi:MAG: hypothetical protein SXV54_16635 [Chloroflexota bacterium]|nr:hypothetical protein [Chloroflexota bacterium]